MNETTSPWVSAAASLPLAFAQVREDPLIDREVIRAIGGAARVIMVASGGCTAALLASEPGISALHLVDPNPAQLSLALLKLQLLHTATPAQRRQLLGHAPMPAHVRHTELNALLRLHGQDSTIFGPIDVVTTRGPDYAGRYEAAFIALSQALGNDVDALLASNDPAQQQRSIAPETTLGRRLDAAFDTILSLPNLVALFGTGATQNPVLPFARHFAERVRSCVARFPACRNSFLWQMLRGCHPPGIEAEWLNAPGPAMLPEVICSNGFMDDALRQQPRSWDVVHLSNILDWLTPTAAEQTLALAYEALRPGGFVIIRQLNSTLPIPGLGSGFTWDVPWAQLLHDQDRSFFYRHLHIGRRA